MWPAHRPARPALVADNGHHETAPPQRLPLAHHCRPDFAHPRPVHEDVATSHPLADFQPLTKGQRVAIFDCSDVLGRDAQLSRGLAVLLEVAQFAVDGDEEARTEHVDQQFLLLLAGVARDVHRREGVVVDIRALLEEAVDDAVDQFLVARDGVRGEHHRVPLSNLQRAVLPDRQPAQDRRRLALRAGRHDDRLTGRQILDLAQRHQHTVRDIEVAQLAGHLGILNHRPAGDGDLAAMLRRHIHDLLDARDERGEGRHDHPAWGLPHHLVEGVVQRGLREGVTRPIRVGAVGKQHQHPAAAELGQFGVIGGPAVHRRVIELEVTAVHDQPGRRRDAQAHPVGDGVADVVGLDGEGTNVDDVAGRVGVQHRRPRHTPPLHLDLDQALGQPRGIDRHVELLQEMGQRADVILVAVRDDNCAHAVFLIAQVSPIGDDVVNPQHVRFGEHDARVHDEDIAAVLNAHRVLTDFPQAAQGYDT